MIVVVVTVRYFWTYKDQKLIQDLVCDDSKALLAALDGVRSRDFSAALVAQCNTKQCCLQSPGCGPVGLYTANGGADATQQPLCFYRCNALITENNDF